MTLKYNVLGFLKCLETNKMAPEIQYADRKHEIVVNLDTGPNFYYSCYQWYIFMNKYTTRK